MAFDPQDMKKILHTFQRTLLAIPTLVLENLVITCLILAERPRRLRIFQKLALHYREPRSQKCASFDLFEQNCSNRLLFKVNFTQVPHTYVFSLQPLLRNVVEF